jgi:phage tail tape-measure protein
VGEVVGGAIGAVIGAVAGPGGAAIGAGLGAFAGSSIGAKLGYDVTHELVHPEAADPHATLDERARALAASTTRRAGEAVGGGIGAAGGALVGTAVAGPLGGRVGAFVGEAIAGELGEEHAGALYRKRDQRAKSTREPEADATPQAESERTPPSTTQWLAKVATETAGETGTAATFSAIGGLVAGDLGRRLGKKTGTMVAKRVKWALPFTWKRKNRPNALAPTEETESTPDP